MNKLKFALGFLLIMINVLSCSKLPTHEPIEEIRSALSILEERILQYDFDLANPSLETINKDFFKILNNAKSTADLLTFRYELQIWLSKFPIEDVSEVDSVIFSSFFTSLMNKSYKEKVIICDMYTELINSLKITTDDKSRLMMSVTLYRDLAIYFEGARPVYAKGDEEFDHELDEGRRNRAYREL